MSDPHATLGVPRTASKADIKKAFRQKAMEYHPDRHAMSPEHVQRSAAHNFKAVNEAYELLMDDSRRHARHGSRPGGFGSAAGAASRAAGSSSSYSSEFHSYYSGFYSGSGYSGYSQFRRRSHFNFGSVFRSFTSGMSRQEALLTLGVGAAILGGAWLLDPWASSLWERQNKGKLFSDIQSDIVKQKQAELAQLRSAREAAAARRASHLQPQAPATAAAALAAAAEPGAAVVMDPEAAAVAAVAAAEPAAAVAAADPATPATAAEARERAAGAAELAQPVERAAAASVPSSSGAASQLVATGVGT